MVTMAGHIEVFSVQSFSLFLVECRLHSQPRCFPHDSSIWAATAVGPDRLPGYLPDRLCPVLCPVHVDNLRLLPGKSGGRKAFASSLWNMASDVGRPG